MTRKAADGTRIDLPSIGWERASLRGSALLGWVGPLLVAAFAAALRFLNLGRPHAVVFDETYYAKDALGLLKFGAPRETIDNANERLLDGATNVFTDEASFVVHPQFGKILIAAGEWLFGVNPFGWRFAAAVVGSLSVLILARVARRMTGSTLLGCVAGLLLALDGLHFVHSRLALLDIFVTLWVLAGFACLVADRDAGRARLADRLLPAGPTPLGPGLGIRPWRLAAGVCFGLACATKWNAVPFVAAFGLLALAWDIGARRRHGVPRPVLGGLVRDAVPAFLSLIVLGLLVYVATWTPWLLSDGGWARAWATGREGGWPLVPAALQSLWHYHQEIWGFHTGLDSSHRYETQPWTWLLLLRPVAYYYTSPSGCSAAECSSAIHGLGTPAIWWFAMPALLVMVWLLVARRDWRAGAVVMAVAAGWVPWFVTTDRTQFLFYALPMLPFLVLALTIGIGLVIGRADASGFRRGLGAALAGAYLLVVIANFYFLYPVLSAEVVPYAEWHARMWLQSWI